jgi:anti-sigma regulatory factor (Ser/Thr protein kinase)
MPERLVQALLPDGPDDDVAVLVARVDPPEGEHALVHRFEASESAVIEARHLVSRHLTQLSVPERLIDDVVLTTSELLTNAIVHGLGPIDMRLRANSREVLLEVQDRATFQPRKLRPTTEDEHGRGLQIVAALADRWGTRATEDGKSVWCVLSAD